MMECQDLESEGVEIIVGTYEEFVLGYKLSGDESEGEGRHVSISEFLNMFSQIINA